MIIKKTESARGCGYRKKGGLYLVTDGGGRPCGKLPIPLTVCPCCNTGIKFSRGFTWVTGRLFKYEKCDAIATGYFKDSCEHCPLNVKDPDQRFGLMWVGEKFYTPVSFRLEAHQKGISKRIKSIPNDFIVGVTWILLAHIKAGAAPVVVDADRTIMEYFPAVFYAFMPSRIEYVIKGDETELELFAMEKRGITLVDITRDIDLQEEINFKP